MPVRGWVRDHSAEGRVARRIEALVGGRAAERPGRVARLEQPRRPGELARRLGAVISAKVGARVGVRLDPGRRAATAVGLTALVAVLVAGAWVLANRPHSSALASARASTVVASTSSPPTTTTTKPPVATVVVDVVGKVANPGVYRLPAGSRVDDALQAAGGVLPGVDLSTINRAQLISDGQQIAVAVTGAPAGGGGSTGSGSTSGPVNLNTATVDQLDALPGVGPVLAQHILAWRQQHGSFTSIDQLREVSGIGEAKYGDLKTLVTV